MIPLMEDTFTVPRLETDRLVLRAPRPSDLDAYAADHADVESRRFIGGTGTRRDAWRAMLGSVGTWIVTGTGWWTIEERATGRPLGSVGAFFRETQYEHGAPRDLELGWGLFRPAWKQGFAREAARAALVWGCATHPNARIIAHIDAENVASAAVATALGMVHAGQVDFYGEPTELYVLPT